MGKSAAFFLSARGRNPSNPPPCLSRRLWACSWYWLDCSHVGLLLLAALAWTEEVQTPQNAEKGVSSACLGNVLLLESAPMGFPTG